LSRPKAANHDRFPDASRYKDEFLKIGVTGAAPPHPLDHPSLAPRCHTNARTCMGRGARGAAASAPCAALPCTCK
jgi:hypothetical protein